MVEQHQPNELVLLANAKVHMGTDLMKEFKRLFYKLYFCDMDVEEVLDLSMCIDSLCCEMMNQSKGSEKTAALNEELNAFGRDLLDLVEEA